MPVFKSFYPDEYLDSAYDIDYEKLYQRGYRGLIFDIDNTLVPHGAPADEQSRTLFSFLRSRGFACCLLSNNHKDRVDLFNKDIGLPFVDNARKPSSKGYHNAMKMMETNRYSTVFIGDQLFTDIWGANRAGIHTILVKPIDPHEEVQIRLKRRLEKIVLYFYKKNKI